MKLVPTAVMFLFSSALLLAHDDLPPVQQKSHSSENSSAPVEGKDNVDQPLERSKPTAGPLDKTPSTANASRAQSPSNSSICVEDSAAARSMVCAPSYLNIPPYAIPSPKLEPTALVPGPRPSEVNGGDGVEFRIPLFKTGGKVSVPRLIFSPHPSHPTEASTAKHQGTAVLSMIVDAEGRPYDIHIVRSIGKGLDEKAIAAARQWRFEPAQKDGKPVPVKIMIKVDFDLF